jgi:predicted metal-dependent peptidase
MVANNRVPTMATDGVSLFYSTNFLESLAPAELVGCLAHEVMHPALKHHTRRGNRDRKLWNQATDYCINVLLVDAGLHLPKGILLNDAFRGMSAEAIYNQLLQESEQEQSSSGSSGGQGSSSQSSTDPSDGQESGDDPGVVETPGGIGQVLDAPNTDDPSKPATPGQLKQQEQGWGRATVIAAATSRMAGKMPLGVERSMEAAAEARIDCIEHLRRCFSEAAIPADYSWSRPNRRFAHTGLFLPSVKKEGVGDLVIAIDCSGSINTRLLSLFQSAIQTLVDEHRPSGVHVLYFDEIVHRDEAYSCGERIVLRPIGGGGTNFRPIFEHIAEQNLCPTATIVLTDLYGDFPDEEPDHPVIWACTSSMCAPFGATVRMNVA